MPRYKFELEGGIGTTEVFPDDQSAKLHACTIADEINRNENVKSRRRVLVFDEAGALLAAVGAVDE